LMERTLELRRKRRAIKSALLAILLVLSTITLLWLEVGGSPTHHGGVIEIRLVYGSEKQGWIEQVIPIFEEEWRRENPNLPVKVHCIPMGSRESMNQILHGQILPTIWSPASSIWIPLANKLWREMYPQYYEAYGPLIREWTPLVHSPIVIITWENFAKEFGIQGFRSLHELSTSKDGRLRFAHTDPQLSNSGMMALILEVSAAVGKRPSELTMEDLVGEEVRRWLKELEGCSVYYGRSTGFLVKKMVSDGPNRMNVVVAYENLVIEENRDGEPVARWGQRLLAIYPQEGTLSSDHPFCLLNAPWNSDPNVQRAARALLNFLLREDIQAIAMEYGFRPGVEGVPLDPSIFNPENGVEAEIPCTILSSEIKGEVLWRIVDLWLVCRAYG